MKDKKKMVESIGLNEMVVALRKDLLTAQEEGAGQDLRFKVDEIDIEVDIVTTKEASPGASVKFWVYNAELKTKFSEVRTHRLCLKLTPKTSNGDLEVSDEDTK
ncbi:MAG: trypco2 family protein [Sedimenticola sp.]